ncbi:hypothetical protein [Kistimonas asteriae]|uniref:hypothetical protein n=1 Tax=Kistimonas asteriae TaxID=517724 RepID=UPI001BA4EF3D|nr:hypothetical protein [Kistimonas asteriae]
MNCLIRSFTPTRIQTLLAVLLTVLLSACSSNPYRAGYPVDRQWTVLPVAAPSEDASIQVELLLTRALTEHGITGLQHPPQSWIDDQTKVLRDAHKLKNASQWARQHGIQLGLTGIVDNWSQDAANRPQVTLSLKLLDIQSGATLWTTTGSSEGQPGVPISEVAQTLINTLLDSLPVTRKSLSDIGWFTLPTWATMPSERTPFQ